MSGMGVTSVAQLRTTHPTDNNQRPKMMSTNQNNDTDARSSSAVAESYPARDEEVQVCSYCNGVGEIRQLNQNGDMIGGYCSNCNGSGVTRKRPE